MISCLKGFRALNAGFPSREVAFSVLSHSPVIQSFSRLSVDLKRTVEIGDRTVKVIKHIAGSSPINQGPYQAGIMNNDLA